RPGQAAGADLQPGRGPGSQAIRESANLRTAGQELSVPGTRPRTPRPLTRRREGKVNCESECIAGRQRGKAAGEECPSECPTFGYPPTCRKPFLAIISPES